MRFLSIALAGSICAGVMASDTLLNRSFEDSGDTPQRTAHWVMSGEPLHRDEDGPTRGGRFSIHYLHGDSDAPTDVALHQEVRATRGATYTFSIYAHIDRGVDGYPPERIEVSLESNEDGRDTVLQTRTYVPAEMGHGEWTRLSVGARALSENLRVMVRVVPSKCLPRTGSVRLDDASLLVSEIPEARPASGVDSSAPENRSLDSFDQ